MNNIVLKEPYVVSVEDFKFTDDVLALREKCRIYEEALQAIESPLSNSRARKIAGEALDHFRCGTCGTVLE